MVIAYLREFLMFKAGNKTMIVLLLFCLTSTYTQAETNNYEQFDGFVIDSVLIENKNIYDLSDDKFDNFIFKTANKLHLKTKKKYYQTGITFHPG